MRISDLAEHVARVAKTLRLPVSSTLTRMMNRRNFSLRKVRKTIPQKKIPQLRPVVWALDKAYERGVKLSEAHRIR